jgi:hypothetical protein
MEARKTENCHVRLLPSIENQENCNRAFLQFDRSLKIIGDPQFEIIKLEKSFRNKKLAIKNSFYDKDGVHLNEDGADMLAKVIFDKTRRIPYNFFE